LPDLPDVANANQKAPEKGVAIVPARTGVNAGWLAAGLGIGVTFLLLGAIGVAVLMRKRNAALPAVSEPKDERPQTATSMAFSCTECGKRIKVRAALVGKKVKCPNCSAVVAVPTSAAVEADTPNSNA
jgi:DNA-directed RNA polymerase subunit RPC12/RpoP